MDKINTVYVAIIICYRPPKKLWIGNVFSRLSVHMAEGVGSLYVASTVGKVGGWYSTEMFSCYRPPTKFREGNVFTPVCLFTGGCMMSLPVWLPGHMFFSGGMMSLPIWLLGPMFLQGGSPPGGMVLTSSGGHQSEHYASYWNAVFQITIINDNQI